MARHGEAWRGVPQSAAARRLGGAEAVLPGERDVGALVPFFWSCGLGATVVPHYAEVAPATQRLYQRLRY